MHQLQSILRLHEPYRYPAIQAELQKHADGFYQEDMLSMEQIRAVLEQTR